MFGALHVVMPLNSRASFARDPFQKHNKNYCELTPDVLNKILVDVKQVEFVLVRSSKTQKRQLLSLVASSRTHCASSLDKHKPGSNTPRNLLTRVLR